MTMWTASGEQRDLSVGKAACTPMLAQYSSRPSAQHRAGREGKGHWT